MIPYQQLDWLRLLVSPRGTFTRGVPLRVAGFGAFGFLAYVVHAYVTPVHLPVGLHEIAGAVIALILAFRTNTAYARFWEGRTLWGAIVNACRNLHRIGAEHAWPDAPAEATEFSERIVLFAHATRRVLRSQSLEGEAARLLGDHPDRAALGAAGHPALACAAMLSRRIRDAARAGRLDSVLAEHAERLVGVLVDQLGGCERILKTPTPLAYVLLMHRVVAFFLATLPLALVAEVGPLTPVLTMMVAYPMMLIEGVGAELDDPFGHDPNDLPLTRICTTVERNLLHSSDGSPVRIGAGSGPAES